MKTIIGVILATLTLAGCSRGPDQTALEQDVQNQLDTQFKQGLFKIASLRRAGTAPSGAGDKQRLLVYFNSRIEFLEDYDLTSWEELNVGVLARVLGATEKGLRGVKSEGNEKGDVLTVYGRSTYAEQDGAWQPVAAPARIEIADAPPLGNTAPRAEALLLLQEIESIAGGSGRRGEKSEIVESELTTALRNINMQLDAIEGNISFATGEAAGEYYRVGQKLQQVMAGEEAMVRSYESGGSIENSRLVETKAVDLALIQNDIAAMAYAGEGVFSGRPPMQNLRALAGLFPEPVQIVVRADSDIRSIADLAGKRVNIGLPESGTHVNAVLILAAHGIELSDLGEAGEQGMSASIEALKAGELDAFVVTLAAPARSLEALAAEVPVRLLSLDREAVAVLARNNPSFVPTTLRARTYPGQDEPVHTVSVIAMLVVHKDASDEEVTRFLDGLFDNVDLISKVGFEASFIDRAKAKHGVTIPFHPSAERYFSKS